MNRAFIIALLFAMVGGSFKCVAAKLPEGTVVLDDDIYFYSWPYPTISPDGQWVAYVSQGYVCVTNVNAPARRRILEVPHSWTWPHFTTGTGDAKKTGSFESLIHGLEREEYQKVNSQITTQIHGLVWTYDSKGFVFGVQEQTGSQGYLTDVDGKLSKIVHIDATTKTRSALVGTLTRDGKYLVSPGSLPNQGIDRPIIWNIAENRPKATCFLYLTPSATSDRWLGIEKDTEQLVIADKNFEVVQRFNETRPEKTFGFELKWSPNEQYVLWRNQIGFDWYSNWEGFWLDLKTAEKKKLTGQYMDENFVFTGRGGEFVRCGTDGTPSRHVTGTEVTGAHITIDPGVEGKPQDIWRVTVDPASRNPGLINLPGSQSFRMSSDAGLFAVLLPKIKPKRPQGIWHLVDRSGHMWALPGGDSGEYVSPYNVVGFADNDQKIIAYDASRLFSLPVSAVKTDTNKVNK